jgi:hypothetical protein
MASCEGDIKCNDSACVACWDIPALTSGCTNVAFGGTATADATEGGDEANRGANLAIDGSACTRWSSGELPSDEAAGRGQTVWQVDLGAAHRIDNLTLWLAMTPAGDVNLALEYGDDGAHWQAEWSGTRPMSGWEPWQYAMTQPTTARYFRVVFFNGPSWSAIRELALWECPDPPSSDGGGDGGGTSPSP